MGAQNILDQNTCSVGGESDRGRRLLTQAIDYYALAEPHRIFASFPVSENLNDGFRDVDMHTLAAAVNETARWLDKLLGASKSAMLERGTVAYIGPSDLRYSILFFAAMKCRKKMLFLSPRNTESQNASMLQRTKCQALLYADEMKSIINKLSGLVPTVLVFRVRSLVEMLDSHGKASPYYFEATYEEIKDEQCLILHSSGSTGDPKLIYMTHGTFSVTDNDTNMPVPSGRRAQNAAQFNFNPPARFYSCFPPYHLAGVQAYIILPTFYKSATLVTGPPNIPPTGFLLSDIMKQQRLAAFYVPPFIIEQWAGEPESEKQAKGLNFVLYGGGTLSPTTGDKLSKVTDVCQMYGSLELGQVQMLVPRPGQWEYLEPNPYEECHMEPVDDSLFEMVLHQHAKFYAHRSLAHNFPDVKIWRTGDLFVPHPLKPGLWRFHSRIDDMLVLSSGHKLRPLEMETLIQGDPLVSGALIVGTRQPQPLLILEPTQPVNLPKNEYIDKVWPTICQANAIAPGYGQIVRSKVILARPDAQFIRAPKGTIIRRLTEALYKDDIDQAFSTGQNDISEAATSGTLEDIFISSTAQFIRSILSRIWPDFNLNDDDDFFSRGMDSLKAIELSRKLNAVSPQRRIGPTTSLISLRMIYSNPSVNKLSTAIVQNMLQPAERSPIAERHDIDSMKRIMNNFSANLPTRSTSLSPGVNIVLIGPRGRLGPHIVRFLLQDCRIATLWCLNRGEDGRERLRRAMTEEGMICNVDDPRLQFVASNLEKPNLGLSADEVTTVFGNADLIMHNAWKVNFCWPLESYEYSFIHSVQSLVNIVSRAEKNPRVVFVSSTAVAQDWEKVNVSVPVPEEPLNNWDITSPLGYGQSKHVSERMLTLAAENLGIPVTILRVGQVAGTTTAANGAIWSRDEWLPSLAYLSKSLGVIPNDLFDIDWIPVDIMAEAVCELSLSQSSQDNPVQIYNLVNPHPTPFAEFVDVLQHRLPSAKQTTLSDWVKKVSSNCVDNGGLPAEDAIAAVKILPFFQYLVESSVAQPKFSTNQAQMASRTMADKVVAIDKTLIELWCDQWKI
ncbi:putative NRPS-like protein biosynthetic cluster [Myotisia sp. PD_48]|nr:putative NRPS-like protein biosynthetic cluster [Myotisia sp. PD_48]